MAVERNYFSGSHINLRGCAYAIGLAMKNLPSVYVGGTRLREMYMTTLVFNFDYEGILDSFKVEEQGHDRAPC
jgi:hypothetical protein